MEAYKTDESMCGGVAKLGKNKQLKEACYIHFVYMCPNLVEFKVR